MLAVALPRRLESRFSCVCVVYRTYPGQSHCRGNVGGRVANIGLGCPPHFLCHSQTHIRSDPVFMTAICLSEMDDTSAGRPDLTGSAASRSRWPLMYCNCLFPLPP